MSPTPSLRRTARRETARGKENSSRSATRSRKAPYAATLERKEKNPAVLLRFSFLPARRWGEAFELNARIGPAAVRVNAEVVLFGTAARGTCLSASGRQ